MEWNRIPFSGYRPATSNDETPVLISIFLGVVCSFRFDVPEFAREEDMTEESFALFRTQVQLRVGNVLKMWIEGYFADFSHGMVRKWLRL